MVNEAGFESIYIRTSSADHLYLSAKKIVPNMFKHKVGTIEWFVGTIIRDSGRSIDETWEITLMNLYLFI